MGISPLYEMMEERLVYNEFCAKLKGKDRKVAGSCMKEQQPLERSCEILDLPLGEEEKSEE